MVRVKMSPHRPGIGGRELCGGACGECELAETGRAISVGPNGLDSKTGFTSSAVAKGPVEM